MARGGRRRNKVSQAKEPGEAIGIVLGGIIGTVLGVWLFVHFLGLLWEAFWKAM